MTVRVLISDQMDPKAAEIFRDRGIEVDEINGQTPGELKAIIGQYDGLAIRSSTKVTRDLLEAALAGGGERQPSEAIQKAVSAAGAKLVVLDAGDPGVVVERALAKDGLQQILKKNLDAIVAATGE